MFEHVSPGSRVPKLKAAEFNAWQDAGKAARRRQGFGVPEAKPRGEVILIRNDSGADLDRGDILGLGDPLVTPTDNEQTFKEEVTFEGPAPSAGAAFAVLKEPCRGTDETGIAEAIVCGVTQCRVSGTGDYARPTAGETGFLTLGDAGPARVLWAEDGTDERWAVVSLCAGNEADDGDADFPPGVHCNESECAEPETLSGASVCCREHATRRAVVPLPFVALDSEDNPITEFEFVHVGGDVWETAEFTRDCGEYADPATYLLRRTLYFDADGRRKSLIELITVDAGGCETVCARWRSCCFIKCPCDQAHKLEDWSGGEHPGEFAGDICLKIGAVGGCLNDAGETLPDIFVVNFPDEMSADPYVVALGGLGPHLLQRETSGTNVCGEELQNMASPYGGCLWVKWENPATSDGVFVAFMRTLLGAERWCVVVGAGGDTVCAPGTYGWYEEVTDFDPLTDAELTNTFESGAMVAPPYFSFLEFGSPEDNAGTTISFRPQGLPSDGGACEGDGCDYYGAGTGGGNCGDCNAPQSDGGFHGDVATVDCSAGSTDCSCEWVWCAATGDPNPIPGVSCGDEPRTPGWILYAACAPL